jgi:predicted ATPase
MSSKIQSTIPKCFTSTIEHQYFDDALKQLREQVQQKTSTRIVIVTGPTGAGKTTLRERLALELEAMAAAEIRENPEMIAYGGCAIKARGGSIFSWKDPYIQSLYSLRHPFAHSRSVAQGQVHSEVTDQILKSVSPDAARRFTNDRLFRILQKTIEHRKPLAMLFDEAHHLLRVGSSMTLVDQLEHIKFIADETRTLFILFGTYELIKLMDLSSALIRRREVVHLARYAYDPNDKQGSLDAFAKVVAVFARDLSDNCEIKLLKEVPYLYQGSVGCVGVLRDWLYRAYARANDSEGRRITMEILKATEFAATDRNQLLTEALNGEDYFAKRALCEQEYLKRLGFVAPNEPSVPKPDDESNKTKPKPFERKPHNDPTGIGTVGPSKEKAA